MRQAQLPAKVGHIPRACGGLGFTIGKAAQGNANSVTTTRAVGSTVGSVDGDVVILAGKNLQLKGSDVIAGQALTQGSGRDTTLTGALASVDTIATNVGRHLTLSNQQEQNHYASQQRRGGERVNASFSPECTACLASTGGRGGS